MITVAGDMNRICSGYIKPLYPDGYEFILVGYSEEDIPELEHMGFYDVTFSNVGNQGSGVIDSLDGIWLHKLQAALAGKDIWNEELDEFLSVIFWVRLCLAQWRCHADSHAEQSFQLVCNEADEAKAVYPHAGTARMCKIHMSEHLLWILRDTQYSCSGMGGSYQRSAHSDHQHIIDVAVFSKAMEAGG